MIRALTVFVDGPSAKMQVVDASVVEVPYVALDRSPFVQLNAYRKPAAVSAVDGSDAAENDTVADEASLIGLSFDSVAVGAKFFTSTVFVYSLEPPSLSMIFPLTVRLPLSIVGQLAVLL